MIEMDNFDTYRFMGGGLQIFMVEVDNTLGNGIDLISIIISDHYSLLDRLSDASDFCENFLFLNTSVKD